MKRLEIKESGLAWAGKRKGAFIVVTIMGLAWVFMCLHIMSDPEATNTGGGIVIMLLGLLFCLGITWIPAFVKDLNAAEYELISDSGRLLIKKDGEEVLNAYMSQIHHVQFQKRGRDIVGATFLYTGVDGKMAEYHMNLSYIKTDDIDQMIKLLRGED